MTTMKMSDEYEDDNEDDNWDDNYDLCSLITKTTTIIIKKFIVTNDGDGDHTPSRKAIASYKLG